MSSGTLNPTHQHTHSFDLSSVFSKTQNKSRLAYRKSFLPNNMHAECKNKSFECLYIKWQWRHLHGQCCRRHVVGQQIISDASVVRISVEVFVACVLNLTMLTSYYACSLLTLERLFCFTYQTRSDSALQHGGGYLVTMDRQFCDVIAPYLYSLLWYFTIFPIRSSVVYFFG